MNVSVNAEILSGLGDDVLEGVDIKVLQNFEAFVERFGQMGLGSGAIQKGPNNHVIVGNFLLTVEETMEFADEVLKIYTSLMDSIKKTIKNSRK